MNNTSILVSKKVVLLLKMILKIKSRKNIIIGLKYDYKKNQGLRI